MKRKLEFRPRSPQLNIPEPVPSSKKIPAWYKSTPIVKENNLTAKRCVPILDSLTAGYMITLPVDVHWDPDNGKPYWYDSKTDMISEHFPAQIDQFELGAEYETQPYKWISHWHTKTPKGYGLLFVHPLNRTELPFYSFSGFVDTDKHPLIVNFPFAIKKGFKGVIPAGTPIIQAIPIKREEWEMQLKDQEKAYTYVKEYEVLNPPFAWYKRNFWTKKKYS